MFDACVLSHCRVNRGELPARTAPAFRPPAGPLFPLRRSARTALRTGLRVDFMSHYFPINPLSTDQAQCGLHIFLFFPPFLLLLLLFFFFEGGEICGFRLRSGASARQSKELNYQAHAL